MVLCATATDGTDLLCVFHAVCIAEEFRGRPFVLREMVRVGPCLSESSKSVDFPWSILSKVWRT